MGGMIHILVIEPDPRSRRTLQDLLSFMGYGEHAAADCQEALAIAAEHRIDVMLVNGELPVIDCQRMRELLLAAGMEIPMVAYAGMAQANELSQAVDHYLESPFVASALNQKIRLAV